MMPVLLSNEDVEQILSMDLCLETTERIYREFANGLAVNAPRCDISVAGEERGTFHVFKTMSGCFPGGGVSALRIASDVLHWVERDGVLRKEKIPVAPGPRWLGLVMLFATKTGELLAIFPDGELSRARVGACNGVGAKYLARQDASRLAVLGSGFQAKSQLQAMCAVRPIQSVKVYSPNQAHRERFVLECAELVRADVQPVAAAEQAVMGADIVAASTNALQAVMEAAWIEPGVHLSCIKPPEFDQAVLEGCDIIYLSSKRYLATQNYFQKGLEKEIPELDWMSHSRLGRWQIDQVPDLGDLVTGKTEGRTAEEQVTCFINNVGLGLQFTVACVVYERARQLGLGKEIPADWFLQGSKHYGHGSGYHEQDDLGHQG